MVRKIRGKTIIFILFLLEGILLVFLTIALGHFAAADDQQLVLGVPVSLSWAYLVLLTFTVIYIPFIIWRHIRNSRRNR